MAESWIVNASPVIVLAKVGRLGLLERGGELLIPDPVALEVLAGPPDDPARQALESGWGRRAPVEGVPSAILEWGLGAGESSVLALALASGATAIIDDAEARACARTLGVRFMGTLGVILRAKARAEIDAAVPVLRAVRAAGLRLDDAVLRTALDALGSEAWDT